MFYILYFYVTHRFYVGYVMFLRGFTLMRWTTFLKKKKIYSKLNSNKILSLKSNEYSPFEAK